MGAEPWDYCVPYEPDTNKALQRLRKRVFEEGAYNGASPDHESIEDAIEDADADGTASILDITHIGEEADFGVARRLTDDELMDYFGTVHPTREMVEENQDYYEDIGRGEGIYVVLYKDDKPSEIFFAGYSYD